MSVADLARRVAEVKARTGREKAGYLDAYLWYLQARSFPRDRVDWSALARAAAHRDRMPSAGGVVRPMSSGGPPTWEFMGPTSMSVPYRRYFGQGSIAGRVNGVAFDPVERSYHFVATAGGGLWGTADRGANWTPLSDGWPFLNTSCVAVDPTNSWTLYVGTGDFDGGHGHPFGIMKSTDKGSTWTNVGRDKFGENCVSAIVVDPDDPRIVTATTGRGPADRGYIWRSVDGGATWNQVDPMLPSWWRDIEISAPKPDGSRTYWAVAECAGGAVLRSLDRGATWGVVTVAQLDSEEWQQLEVACSPTDPDTVYLVAPAQRLVLRHTSGGVGGSWDNISSGFPNGSDNYFWSQRGYNLFLTCSTMSGAGGPVDVLYVGCISIAQWVASTATWHDIGKTASDSARTHNDQHAAAVDPQDSNYLLIGNDGGVYGLSYSPGSGSVSFDTSLNATLGITQFYGIDAHPTDPDVMMGGSQDNATPYRQTAGSDWTSAGGGDGGICAIHPTNPDYRFGTSQNLKVYGTTWNWALQRYGTPLWGRKAFIAPIAFDPVDPNKLYAGTNYLCRMNITPGGLIPTFSWTMDLGGVELAPGGTVSCITVAPSDSKIIYTGATTGEVFMTMDAGAHWTTINAGLDASTSLPAAHVRAISVHPTNPLRVYVALSGSVSPHLFRCSNTNAGASRTWNSASGVGNTALPDIHCLSVVHDPHRPDSAVWAGTDVGVFMSLDNGSTWSNATGPMGLPNVQVDDLKVKPSGYIYAGTFGRGIWRMQLATAGVSVTAPNGAESFDQNSSMMIRWKYTGTPGYLRLRLLRGGAVVKLITSTALGGAGGAGLYEWTIPADVPVGDNYRISITAVNDESVTDVSDAEFSITELTKLLVTAPNGGETWKRGRQAQVSWIYGGSVGTHVTVELRSSGSFVRNIAERIPVGSDGSGSTTWTVPTDMALGSSYTVRVTSVLNKLVTDDSNASFSIAEAERIVVTDPNGGQLLERAQPYTIRWNYYGSPSADVSIRLYKSGVLNRTIVASTSVGSGGTGSFVWTVAADQATGPDYRVRVTSTTDSAVTDESDADFSVGLTRTRCRATDNSGAIGQTVALAARLTEFTSGDAVPGKTVVYSIDGVDIGSAVTNILGSATLSWQIPETVKPIDKAFRVAFDGDSVFQPNSGIGILTVSQAGTTLAMADTHGAIGSTVTFLARLNRNTGGAPVAGRVVEFTFDGAELGQATTDDNGWAAYHWTLAEGGGIGSVRIVATFAGDQPYTGSTTSAWLTISKSPTYLEMNGMAGRIGETVDLTSFLSRVSDGQMLPNCTVSYRVSTIDAGSTVTGMGGDAVLAFKIPESLGFGGKTVTAEFAGDSSHSATSQIATLTVSKSPVDIAVQDATGTIGGFFDIVARLTRATDDAPLAGRTLVFKIDGTQVGQADTDAAGQAVRNWFVLDTYAPSATISAEFAGDLYYLSGTGSGTLTVPKANTLTSTITRTGVVGEAVTLRGYLKRTVDNAWLDGRVLEFLIDGSPVGKSQTGATGTSGRADYIWTITPGPGTRTIRVEFAGDAAYNASSGTAPLTAVTWGTKMVGFDRTARITARTELKARLVRSDNVPLYNKPIDFAVDGTFVITRPTDTQGYARYPNYDVPSGAGAGTRTIHSKWVGNDGYLPSEKTATLTVLKALPYIWVQPRTVALGAQANLYAYFRRLYDYQKQAGKQIDFRVDGTFVASAVTDAGGVARYSYHTIEAVGDHTIRCEFAGDAYVGAGYGEGLLRVY